jgi:AcrR family transcriptional regulator
VLNSSETCSHILFYFQSMTGGNSSLTQMQEIPKAGIPSPEAPIPRRGRPRDPGIEERIFEAALKVYAENGWLGFNFEAVARVAGVGKDAIHRRWKTRDILLASLLGQRWDWVRAIDTGDLREDLLQLARLTFDLYAGTHGEVVFQLRADARRFEEVAAVANPYRAELVRLGRNIVQRAIERGDFPAQISPGLIMDLLIGGIVNHVSSTPSRLRDTMIQKSDEFIVSAVDFLVAAAQRAPA